MIVTVNQGRRKYDTRPSRSDVPASTHRPASSNGKVAKCAPENGFVAITHKSRQSDMAITEEGRASIIEARIVAGRTRITEADRTGTGMDDGVWQ
jgi:hypothetical protein